MNENKYNLTPKQLLFCHEYIKDLNATQAVVRAGYSKKTARIIAAQNLSKLNIQRFLSELISNRFKLCDLKAEMIIEEYIKIAFSNISDYLETDGKNIVALRSINDIHNSAAVSEIYFTKTGSSVKLKIRLHDKLHALDKLADYLNILNKGKVMETPKPAVFVVPGFKDFKTESNRISRLIKEGTPFDEIEV